MGRYRFAEGTALADCAIDLEAGDLDDLFETAADALAALMVDPDTVEPTIERAITLAAEALDLLLFDWLSELIADKDTERRVYTRCRARVDGFGPSRLEAHARGGVLDERTALRADAKAVTLHQLSVESADDGWRARVVIDI